MKSLDERLSTMLSLYDEQDITEEELLIQQELLYQKDIIVNSIGDAGAKIEFDLHIDEVLQKMPAGSDYSDFMEICLKKLSEKYYLDVLYDHIQRQGLVVSNPDSVLDLIKFFVYDKWLENIAYCLPEININTLHSTESIKKIISESYLSIMNKIIKREDVNSLVRFYFNYCPEENGIQTLSKLILSDLPGIISVQLVTKIK